MWRYISDAATRFVTSVWNSLTFVFNLIPAPFVLLSINYKLLTFKNIFAFARAGFGSYSNLKMLANAVLVEKKPDAAAGVEGVRSSSARLASRHERSGETVEPAHDVQEHEKDREQKIKAEMFKRVAFGIDKIKFAKDGFASLVRAMGLLKGTNFFSEDEVLKTEQVSFLVEAGDNAELFAKLYLDCVSFAEQYKVNASVVFNDIVEHNQLVCFGVASPVTKKGLTAIMRNQKLLILSMSKTMQARINKMLAELSKVLMAQTILSADGTLGLPALAAVASNLLLKIMDKSENDDDAKASRETRRGRAPISDAGSDRDADDDVIAAEENNVAGILYRRPGYRLQAQSAVLSPHHYGVHSYPSRPPEGPSAWLQQDRPPPHDELRDDGEAAAMPQFPPYGASRSYQDHGGSGAPHSDDGGCPPVGGSVARPWSAMRSTSGGGGLEGGRGGMSSAACPPLPPRSGDDDGATRTQGRSW